MKKFESKQEFLDFAESVIDKHLEEARQKRDSEKQEDDKLAETITKMSMLLAIRMIADEMFNKEEQE